MWIKEDVYYKRAKREGYRSRAAFKLIQINRKFKLIKRGDVVVDLGAAPGGWSQVAKEIVGRKGVVIGVDIQKMEKIEGVISIVSDITNVAMTVEAIKHFLKHPADVVISDASPNLSGHKSYDHFRSFELSKASLDIACSILKDKGNFVTKIFQGEDLEDFRKEMRMRFTYTKVYSPEASRKGSSEVYVIGKGFRGE
ncbi:MAG: RlmE family RNA methyltransferase [Candidatus Methanospirareceae archaeon]